MSKNRTSDAVKILHQRYFEGKPEMMALLEQVRLNANIAQKIYDLRTKAGLTQRELAERVGTTASVICRLEDADYEGHSVYMLQRIAAAAGKQVEVHFVPVSSSIASDRNQKRKENARPSQVRSKKKKVG